MRVMNEVSFLKLRMLRFSAWKHCSNNVLKTFEPGIDVVRNRIKGFAQKKVTLPQGRHKLVILDEADR